MKPSSGALAFTHFAQLVLNRLLQLDSALLPQLAALSGMALLVESQSPELRLYLLPAEDGLHFEDNWQGRVDCRLSAPASAWLSLLREQDKKTPLQQPPFVVQGDIGLALQLADILQSLRIDPEHELAERLGPLPVALLAGAVRRSQQWADGAGESVRQSLAHYLATESALLPSRSEAQARFAEVAELEQRLSALEEKTQRLTDDGA